MTVTFGLGWWLLPTAVTIAAFVAVYLFGPKMRPNNGGMFPDVLGGIMELGSYLLAVVASLIAWLLWALL